MSYTRNAIFKWNFGDGSQGAGDMATHTYEYPGDYVVVLNVSVPEGQAVARSNVKIIDPELSVAVATNERIELKNNSKYEVSLFGKALTSGGKVFLFPQDTIIRAGQSLSFSSHVTGLQPNGLYDTNVLTVGENTNLTSLVAKMSEQKSEQIAQIQNEISVLQKQLASMLSVPPPH